MRLCAHPCAAHGSHPFGADATRYDTRTRTATHVCLAPQRRSTVAGCLAAVDAKCRVLHMRQLRTPIGTYASVKMRGDDVAAVRVPRLQPGVLARACAPPADAASATSRA